MIAALVGCALLAADATAQESVRRVGVVVTMHVNVTTDEALGLAEALAIALQDALPVEVIRGREVERRLPAGGVRASCVAEAPCRIDVGQRLDADEILFLSVVRIGDQVQIDLTWTDVASGRIGSRPAIEFRASDEPRRVFADVAPKLLPHLVQRKDEQRAPSVIVVPADLGSRPGRRVSPATWIAAGVGVAALVGGSVFTVSAQRKYDALDQDGCRVMMCAQEDIDRLRAHALAADALFATAAVSGVAALIFYALGDDEPGGGHAARAPVGVDIGAGRAMLSVGGAF